MIKLVPEISEKQREWRNDPRIMDWCRQNELISEEDQKKWEERIRTDPTIRMFGIEIDGKHESGCGLVTIMPIVIGAIGLTSLNLIHRTAEFSLFIGPEWQRRGYAREALKELLKYGFQNLDLECIWGETFVGNPAMKLFEEIGFQNEGIHRSRYNKNGKRVDAYSISILKHEFLSKHPS